MASPDVKIEILPFDPQAITRVDLRPTLERLYLPEVVFGDWAIRTGRETFDAFYTVRAKHCDPLGTPQLRGAITVDGNKVTNSFVIDSEDPEGRPLHTFGHIRRVAVFPGHMAFGATTEAVSFDQPMDVVEFASFDFGGPGRPRERLTATAVIVGNETEERTIGEALVTINGREHAKGRNLVFVPSRHPRDLSLPQFRLLEIGAQLAGAGMQTLIGSLPEGYAMIYVGIGQSIFVPAQISPEEFIKGQGVLSDISRLGEGKYLFSLDIQLFNEDREIANLHDVSLGLFPEQELINILTG